MTHFDFTQSSPQERPDGPPPWVAAPLRARVIAALLDSLVVLVIGGVCSIVAAFALGVPEDSTAADLTWPMALGMPAGAILYVALLEGRRGRHNGQTLGKSRLHIRTVSNDGTDVGHVAAWLRSALVALPLAWVAFPAAPLARHYGVSGPAYEVAARAPLLLALIAIGVALTSQFRRAPQDHLTGTTVVFSDRLDESWGSVWAPERSHYDASPVVAPPPRPHSRLVAAAAIVWIILAAFGPNPF